MTGQVYYQVKSVVLFPGDVILQIRNVVGIIYYFTEFSFSAETSIL